MILVNRLPIKRFASVLLALLLLVALALPTGARAAGKVVRVGWFESPFNATDEFGRRSGYAYEYQQKIAAYTGWTYEYVEGSWPELLQMLMDGRNDLLSDVSYTPERTAYMQFSSLPMGEEEYYVFVAPGNDTITAENYTTFNGKRVGVNKGSFQAQLFRDWCKTNGVRTEVVELMDSVEDCIEMLQRGELDMYVSLDAYIETSTFVPICKIGGSDFYFAVSNSAPELLTELNNAMNRIHDANPYFNQQLYSKYIETSGVNLFLSADEKAWLAGHGPIRVGYQDNYLALCGTDTATGELTGALKDYLAVAAECMENATMEFEAVAYPTSAAAMEALARGEVDCAFPANLTDYDAEAQGFFMTPALMSTDMSAVVREADQKTFAKKDRVLVAVNAGNPNYDMFLLDNYPGWRAVYFHDTQECLEAIADEKADCLIISNYRYNNIARQCEKLHLTTVSTGVEMDYYFAVNRTDTQLYSILAKTAAVVPVSTINAALSHYFTEDAKASPGDFLRQNMTVLISIAVVIVLVITFLLFHVFRARKKSDAEERLISATETDELTGLYNKSYFYEYANQLYREQPERPMDAMVMNIEQFHSVNALSGRVFGDQVLQLLGSGVLAFLNGKRGVAGREEGDSFVLYCQHIEDYQKLFDRFQGILDALSTNASLRLRMGVMPWQENTEPQQLIEQAHVACGLARGNFKELLVVFDDKLRRREALEQRLLNELNRALDNREIEVWYQPKFNIQTEPPAFKSAEALVRWRHPELGMIAPGDFIPLLERNGQIGTLDKFVWAEAARQLAVWKKQYALRFPVSVNLSRVDIFDPTLESSLELILENSGLDHSDLKLEVTESACTENTEQVLSVIKWLRNKGFEVEMDDFGAGYSSLSMLSSMPIDVLKMDKAFVGNIESSEKDVQLVKLILGIARELNVHIVAEGVETAEQLRILRELGCELVQGFVFSRPLPAAEFESAILRGNGEAVTVS